MEILDFIAENAYILVAFYWVVGFIIKNTDLIKDKYIPFILLGISFLLSPWLLGGYNPNNIIQSGLVVGGAVLADQLGKQARKDE